ncbi:MAG: DNA-3-methyladenine glycosylase [Candidatus Nanohaloarchaea archaeon]
MNCGSEELTEDFFHGRVTDIAEELIGKLLVNEDNGAAGVIVETEAYLGVRDPASHLVNAGEKRRETFERGAGTVYVFKIYRHSNLNFLTEREGVTEGVLVRAAEPVEGIEEMKKRRRVEEEIELCSGPGKLCEAFGITKDEYNKTPVGESPLSVYRTGKDIEVKKTGRIGISSAEKWPLRFEADNPHVSERRDSETEGPDFEEFYTG